MTATTTVEGYSDDLVEIEGAIREEFDSWDTATLLEFDNGVKLRVEYGDDGVWRIRSLADSPHVVITKAEDRPGWAGADGAVYSDLATITGADPLWITAKAVR